jgi:hypothetical protein
MLIRDGDVDVRGCAELDDVDWLDPAAGPCGLVV